jgi:predicted  nucleic acid-binding Zn-ribbon protein
MSIETATQRLNTALGDLEAKVARRLNALESDVVRLRGERDALQSEIQSLKAAPTVASSGIDPEAHAALTQQSNLYKATLKQTLADIDSLISRVSSAA